MTSADLEAHPEVAPPLSPLQLGRASLTYAFGGLAYKGVALLSVPILARLLSPAQLGLLDLAAVLASIVGLTVAMGTDQSVAYHETRVREPAELWASALALVAAGGILAIGLGLLLREPLAVILTGRSENGGLVAAASVYGAVMALSAFALVTIRLRAPARAYALASFLIVSAEMAAALTIAWLLADPVSVMVVAWALGSAAISVPFLVRFLPQLQRPTVASMRRLVAYGGPLVPATMAWLIGDVWIRATLARDADLVALGEYGIAYRIASVLGLLVTGIGVAWYPYISSTPKARIWTRSGEALVVVTVALGAIAVAMSLLSPEVIGVIAGPPYAGAQEAVGPLLAGMVAFGMFTLARGLLGTSGSTRTVGLAAGLGLAIQLALSSVLVSRLGLSGAAIASLSGYVGATLMAFAAAGRLPRRSALAIGTVAIFVGATLVGVRLILDWPLAYRIMIASAVVLAAALLVTATTAWRRTGGRADE